MQNYKALKSAGKVSVRKQKVVLSPADESKGVSEVSEQQLQLVCKSYNPLTGEANDDVVKRCSLSEISQQIDNCKSEVAALEAEQADLEQLEKDLKAL